jgi:hypothetical protein
MIDRVEFIREQLAFRIPRKIDKFIRDRDGFSTFYCPSCNRPIGRDYEEFCCSCGQHLDWTDIEFKD